MRGMQSKRLLAVGAAAIALTASLGATSAHAISLFNVYTGYADNLRPSGFFPTPWLGDANVVSQTPTGQSLDSGAVRIQNTSGGAITISNFNVVMNGGSGPTYAIWNALTIGVGQDGIFTQTGSYNFDSSDNSTGGPPGGINGSAPGSNGIGGCSSTPTAQALAVITAYCAGRIPIVSFDIGVTHYVLADSGHILDTGNYDFINGSPDGNESINWNLIGQGASRTGTPEPGTWALMILGFGAAGAMLRRARKGAVA